MSLLIDYAFIVSTPGRDLWGWRVVPTLFGMLIKYKRTRVDNTIYHTTRCVQCGNNTIEKIVIHVTKTIIFYPINFSYIYIAKNIKKRTNNNRGFFFVEKPKYLGSGEDAIFFYHLMKLTHNSLFPLRMLSAT